VRRRRTEIWKSGSWVLRKDNAPANNVLSIKTLLAKHKNTVFEQLPYSSDLAPCDFFLSPTMKCVLKGTRFVSVDAVKAKATELINI
jgi:hypothetical protein